MSNPIIWPRDPTARARAIVWAPPPHPMSQTRWPASTWAAARRWGVRASVRRSRLGQAATH